ncbi:putative alpha/beta hydrolase [Ilyonectria robusta]
MATTLQGKGIFFVNSKIARPDILDVPTFLKWYDDDHIPEIIETSGIRSARRFVDIDPEVGMPYLAMYPMEDIGFTQSQEFRNIHVTSDILPGDNSIYDLADINARCDNLICVYDKAMAGKGAMKSLVVIACEIKGSASPEEVEQWFREKHCASMAESVGYLRTMGFKLASASSNAQLRVLKGLDQPTKEPAPQPATWLSLHEFSCDASQLDGAELGMLATRPWGKDAFGTYDVHIYKLAKEVGEKDWFHGVEV